MSTEKEPDYKGIAERLAAKKHPGCSSCESLGVWHCAHPDECGNGNWVEPYRAYTSCMEARLRSDWETIRLLRRIRPDRRNCIKRINPDGSLNQGPTCRSSVPSERMPKDQWCWVCNAQDRLSKLLELFTP